jgi:hypothetical protein
VTHTILARTSARGVLQDAKLLESAGLEPPSIVRLFSSLKTLKLIDEIPLTYEETHNIIAKQLTPQTTTKEEQTKP